MQNEAMSHKFQSSPGVTLSLAGRTALITGGSRGIGAATVRLFRQAGARVAFSYHSAAEQPTPSLRSVAEPLFAFPSSSHWIRPKTAKPWLPAPWRLSAIWTFWSPTTESGRPFPLQSPI